VGGKGGGLRKKSDRSHAARFVPAPGASRRTKVSVTWRRTHALGLLLEGCWQEHVFGNIASCARCGCAAGRRWVRGMGQTSQVAKSQPIQSESGGSGSCAAESPSSAGKSGEKSEAGVSSVELESLEAQESEAGDSDMEVDPDTGIPLMFLDTVKVDLVSSSDGDEEPERKKHKPAASLSLRPPLWAESLQAARCSVGPLEAEGLSRVGG
jgi:hypothetical protein